MSAATARLAHLSEVGADACYAELDYSDAEVLAEGLYAVVPVVERDLLDRAVAALRARFGVTNRAADYLSRHAEQFLTVARAELDIQTKTGG